MNDTDSDTKGGRRTASRGGTVRGSVRQSFSHGRSHAVVVEKKKKRLVSAPEGGKSSGGGTLTLKPKPKADPPKLWFLGVSHLSAPSGSSSKKRLLTL